ncbi:adenylate cyclase encoded by the PaAC protein [Podospora fimiseda]|uniref:Adenylate cyclase n=1 Tax=Podospora fimiseda TaxID=252190 RepID=A0AAN7BYW0_9PEZI|nr:adenylate cyclase encoded by the PaAC protein [Podospora fimiseda]
MPRNDASSRFSSMTGSSTDSARSNITVKPLPLPPVSPSLNINNANPQRSNSASHASRRAAPSRLKTDENSQFTRPFKDSDAQVSPTSASGSRLALSPSSTVTSNASIREHRMSDLADYRRDLAILDPAGGRTARNQHNNPSTGSLGQSQIAPWIMAAGALAATPAAMGPLPTSFYNDSTDNLSINSQVSPGIRPSTNRPPQSSDSPDLSYFTDERRPSIASITTTASSQGSRTSGPRGGFRKLQGFFGEEFPGRDSSENSLAHPVGKEHRSHSYSSHVRPHRDRNYSNATDHGRDASPASRPRTPVPAPEVVPFLYQEADDIARYGEAPVRDILSGPDRDRYANNDASQANPPKTSSSGRSGHSIVHLAGHHRHNKSNEDPRSLRPSISREDSAISAAVKDRSGSSAMYGARSRAQSPAPSGNGGYWGPKNGSTDGQTSPGHPKKSIFTRLRGRNKDKDETSELRKLPSSSHSLQSRPSKQELPRSDAQSIRGQEWKGGPSDSRDGFRPDLSRQVTGPGTFNNKFSLSKKARTAKQHDDLEDSIGPTDRQDGGTVFHLDTNLNDMEGILSKPMPLTPLDATDFLKNFDNDNLSTAPTTGSGHGGAWNAPDSWAVRRDEEEPPAQPIDMDDLGSPPRPEEKLANYCIRVFRADGTFTTLQQPLLTSVLDLVNQIVRRTYRDEDPKSYKLLLKKHGLYRVLRDQERPLLIQKRLLEQIGFVERDRIEELGREDNSYVCRFLFYSVTDKAWEVMNQADFLRTQKNNHVDLSGRNLTQIPVMLYPRAAEIISLNLSKNLSLEVPRDFITSCTNLRDIKYNNNEARVLPLSFNSASKLTYLDVSNNRVESLDNSQLHRLSGLLKLNFANNKLKDLPEQFGAFSMLRTLNISSNSLEHFPSFLTKLESLVDLDLSFNLIRGFPEAIGNMRSLEKFVVTNNQLSGTLPHTFKNLSNLRELDIRYNQISNIDVIAKLPKLEILSATHNAVSQFSGSFERIRSLKLNYNPLTKFEIKSPVPTLKALNLSHSQLASIDESFNNIPSLERLELDKNYFVSLPNQIGNLRRLEFFSIAHNSVGELPPELGCLKELKRLDVRGNNIRKLPMELWWANKLEYLNASSNILDAFPKPASREPQPPGDSSNNSNGMNGRLGPPTGTSNGSLGNSLSPNPSTEELNDPSRRPSQASSSLLSVGSIPGAIPGDRKPSMVAMYGKGGRKTSIVSRSTAQGTPGMMTPTSSSRKDSNIHNQRLTNTFAGSLRHLYLADNQLDDDCFEQLVMLENLRVLNLSYNDLNDMPQRSIKSWPQLVELYLSGNELSSIPADDLEDYSMLQTLHINCNKFTNLSADISRAKKLTVFDCGSNALKYNIGNISYDWNWSLNPNLRYLNLSGNRRLEIKHTAGQPLIHRDQKDPTDFNTLNNLRVLGLMDVTVLTSLPDQNEDRRVRTSGALAGYMPYGMADTLGSKNEHLSTIDLVVPRFNSNDMETLLGLFDGQALSFGGSKIAKYLQENFGQIFAHELRDLKLSTETPEDALRRAFLSLNKELIAAGTQHAEERSSLMTHRGSTAPLVLSREDLNSGAVATVAYIQNQELYIANVGDVQAMMIQSDGQWKMLTKKHDPADSYERTRIREAGGWVSRNGKLNDILEVSRAFGYLDLMPAVQSAPHIRHHTIGEQDETILIATKEIWEYLPPDLLVDIARSERGDQMRAAQKLRDIAMAYGCTNKMMVMLLNVSNLKQRRERSRQHRGQSMSVLSTFHDDQSLMFSGRKTKKNKADAPLDSKLQRLEQEVPAPTGLIAIVFTDIKNSTQLWENYPNSMRTAIKLHNDVMRRQLRRIGGFEVKTEGDAFMVSFPTATSALLWCFAVQISLLQVVWPSEMLSSSNCTPVFDRDNKLIFRGLSVRMGIHWGEPLAEPDPVTRRMDYYGPMVNKASRISACADGGQVTVSADFIAEIQRCLEITHETSEADEDEETLKAIRKELRDLSSQGFEVKDMGEKKLKGLENPEYIYSLYPHVLAGRMETHSMHERDAQNKEVVRAKPATLSPGSQLAIEAENIWALWKVSLRLEMLCSILEDSSGTRSLQPPETELLEKMKQQGGELSEASLLAFMEHQVSRIETCVTTLALRQMIINTSPNPHNILALRTPMKDVLAEVAEQFSLVAKYREKYGDLE